MPTDLLRNPPLPRSFYDRDVIDVARDLLGYRLIRLTREGICSGRIVEVEAYLAEHDSACHAAAGRTRKNRSMFGSPGRAYVYPIHSRYCFNAVTQAKGTPSAVLIRALEPLEGLFQMQQRRYRDKPLELARGPGRLCQALAIDRRQDGWNLTSGRRLWITEDESAGEKLEKIVAAVRVGVTSAEDLPLRFFLAGNRFVSLPRSVSS